VNLTILPPFVKKSNEFDIWNNTILHHKPWYGLH
jgi:hypothetical protein